MRGAALGGGLAVLVNADGLVRLAGSGPHVPGAFNPVIGPVVTLLTWVLLVQQSRMRAVFRGVDWRLTATMATVVAAFVVFGTMGSDTSWVRLLRDLSYLAFSYASFLLVVWWLGSDRLSIRVAVRTTAGLTLGVGPLIALLAWGLEPGARFGGMVLSFPMFAASSCLCASMILVTERSWAVRLLAVAASVVWIVLSGTRSILAISLIATPVLLWAYPPRSATSPRAVFGKVLAMASMGGLLGLLWRRLGGLGGVRVFSVSDLAEGSVASRLAWIQRVWVRLAESRFAGGFGAGAAENVVGVLPHLDLLRVWFDYSIVGALAVLAMIVLMSRGATSDVPLLVVGAVLGIVLVLTTHNVLQSPGTLALSAVLLALTRQTRPVEGLPSMRNSTLRCAPGCEI